MKIIQVFKEIRKIVESLLFSLILLTSISKNCDLRNNKNLLKLIIISGR